MKDMNSLSTSIGASCPEEFENRQSLNYCIMHASNPPAHNDLQQNAYISKHLKWKSVQTIWMNSLCIMLNLVIKLIPYGISKQHSKLEDMMIPKP
ncbi:hypothetical protein SADUNF_Sadunf06G0035700 [Salix dunnii]|uniref:Uncharacterized protein n=1 Tax=Salix dunnii TaxID=1413687 RepID=A0A835MW83_9ROSI|nr:hypothetical protein SADUNF_Sadunf06G0035700 [Salix dunnii]